MGPDNRTHWQEPEQQTSNPGSSQRYGLAGTQGHGVHSLPKPTCGPGEGLQPAARRRHTGAQPETGT